jgi:hypothetical protein
VRRFWLFNETALGLVRNCRRATHCHNTYTIPNALTYLGGGGLVSQFFSAARRFFAAAAPLPLLADAGARSDEFLPAPPASRSNLRAARRPALYL